MSLRYAAQSAKDLTCLFIDTPIKIGDNFNIIRSTKFITTLGRLSISVIGESHAIQFQNSEIKFIEILADIKNKNLYKACKKIIHLKNLKKGNEQRYRYNNGFFNYHFMIRKEAADEQNINRLLSSLKRHGSRNKLLFEWPDKWHSESAPSFTYLEYEASGNSSLGINTFHFYKNDALLITTFSNITYKERLKSKLIIKKACCKNT